MKQIHLMQKKLRTLVLGRKYQYSNPLPIPSPLLLSQISHQEENVLYKNLYFSLVKEKKVFSMKVDLILCLSC